MSVKILQVSEDNNGRRLDNYLISIYKNIPKSKIYNIIRKGEVRINSGRVKPNNKIKTGDKIRIPPYLNQIEKKVNFLTPNLLHHSHFPYTSAATVRSSTPFPSLLFPRNNPINHDDSHTHVTL